MKKKKQQLLVRCLTAIHCFKTFEIISFITDSTNYVSFCVIRVLQFVDFNTSVILFLYDLNCGYSNARNRLTIQVEHTPVIDNTSINFRMWCSGWTNRFVVSFLSVFEFSLVPYTYEYDDADNDNSIIGIQKWLWKWILWRTKVVSGAAFIYWSSIEN
jgi:hypothetical protein